MMWGIVVLILIVWAIGYTMFRAVVGEMIHALLGLAVLWLLLIFLGVGKSERRINR